MTGTPDAAVSDERPEDGQDSISFAGVGAFRWTEQRNWIGAGVLLAALVVFSLLDGGWGALAWVIVACSWFVFPPVVPVALGQFALVALTPSSGEFIIMLSGSAALFALLVSDIFSQLQDISDGLRLLGIAVLLGGGALGFTQVSGIGAGVIVTIVTFATASYLLHRLLLFKLGHLTKGAG